MEKCSLSVTVVSLNFIIYGHFLCGGGANLSFFEMRDTLGNRIRLMKLTNYKVNVLFQFPVCPFLAANVNSLSLF